MGNLCSCPENSRGKPNPQQQPMMMVDPYICMHIVWQMLANYKFDFVGTSQIGTKWNGVSGGSRAQKATKNPWQAEQC